MKIASISYRKQKNIRPVYVTIHLTACQQVTANADRQLADYKPMYYLENR